MPTNPDTQSRGPLAGIKVVEFAGIGPGPFCGMLLADMGAEVTLLERAGGTFASQLFGGGRKAVANRGKKSLCIDLKHPEAKALVFKLIEDADVLIEGFRPGVMERLGFGPDECLALNPRLIYGRMTGWGQTGPLAPRAGHDANYAAIAGVLDTGRHHGGAPWAPPTLVGDMGGGGLMLAWGIACALLEAQRSGKGQVIDAAMCEGAAVLAHGLFNLEALGEWHGHCAIDSSARSTTCISAPTARGSASARSNRSFTRLSLSAWPGRRPGFQWQAIRHPALARHEGKADGHLQG
jgi:alpha-methylacyl-CoA racemase